eukprot:TRINITY_DN4277_c1_g1_i1.p2 TRINITY_DN4277_c1_g1~~TRINITY_DN4277_c1_g1_i1.p2  ORF type:complete len:197 (+),score=40.50 TRINITY_DN4277_c1_g1_i1:1429-2019(+)
MARRKHHKNVYKLLKVGSIVVSERQNTAGIEYLVPFFSKDDNELIVAAVHIKCSAEAAQKKKMSDCVEGAEDKCAVYKYLEKPNRSKFIFTVVDTVGTSAITTKTPKVDDTGIPVRQASDWRKYTVLYNSKGLSQFLEPLGPLQLLLIKSTGTKKSANADSETKDKSVLVKSTGTKKRANADSETKGKPAKKQRSQ